MKPRFCLQSLMGTPLFVGHIFQRVHFCNEVVMVIIVVVVVVVVVLVLAVLVVVVVVVVSILLIRQ